MRPALIIIIGLSGGLAVGGSIAAFLTVLGVVKRAVECTGTRRMLRMYELLIALGAFWSALAYFFGLTLNASPTLVLPVGLFMGAFVGFIAGALTETLDILSGVAEKAGVPDRIYVLVVAILLGKSLGSIVYYLFPGFF